ncbi:protein YAE1-like [Zingiber officinale]|uniref:protein YAE1-like n=1 Tax=Zingiber officinale TaxID=94328 RepID=UPI001C4B3B12|nr:protein YAE1-like [Zingiber officinale]
MVPEGPMAEEHLATSIGELTLEKVVVSSIGFEENVQIEHASDDCWFDDEPPVETSDAELIREQKWRHDHFYTMGYRDGISAGKEASAQEGFNVGFKQSAHDGYKWGNVRGIASAFASLPDDSKKKLLKKFDDKEKFHSLYESVQAISTDNALKIYYVHLLQNDKQFKEQLKGNPQESASASAGKESNSDELNFLLEVLTSLVHESSRIKSSIVEKSGFDNK